MRATLSVITPVIGWVLSAPTRLQAALRRAWGEDLVFQALNNVQEARTCLESVSLDGTLVDDWDPEEYLRHALQHLTLAERQLKHLGSYE